MGIMSQIESMMQNMVEGPFGRIFRSRLQPVELTSRLTREMERNLQLGSDRKIAPNLYDVFLSQRDYEQFTAMGISAPKQIADRLIAVARERGYMLLSRPIIRFQLDGSLVTGQARVQTKTLNPSAADAESGVDETRSMTPEEARELARQAQAQQENDAPPPAWLTLMRPAQGQPLRFAKPVMHIGRHLSNEVIINDKRVSRYHAEIRYERGQFVLYDLGSTNGVGINGVTTHQPVPLKNNDRITVGSHEFIFQRK